MKKFRKNDRVQVITGKDKGKTGKVIEIFPKLNRLKLEKINMMKRHMRPTQKNPQGGIIEKEMPLHCSNVLLMCPKCARGVRYGYKMIEGTAKTQSTKQKVRVCKRCGETLETAA